MDLELLLYQNASEVWKSNENRIFAFTVLNLNLNFNNAKKQEAL